MALASVLKLIDFSRRRKRWRLAVTISGNYTTGGDTLDLTAVTNPSFIPAGAFAQVPDEFECQNPPGGYSCEVIVGTALNNSKVKFFSAPGTELAAGAYPAAITGDTLYIVATAKAFRS